MTYTIQQFSKDLDEPYAWPGGYPRYFITNDGAALSYDAARENRRLIEESIREACNDGWQVVACEINWEDSSSFATIQISPLNQHTATSP
jgi:hypothetical protein